MERTWSVGKAGATWRRRVVLISTGQTERLSQRLTKVKPHLTLAPLIDQTRVRIHFRKVVSTSIRYRFNILNLYPIQGHTDTIFETYIQSKIIRIRFLKFVSNLELFGYYFSNFCILIQNYPRYYNIQIQEYPATK